MAPVVEWRLWWNGACGGMAPVVEWRLWWNGACGLSNSMAVMKLNMSWCVVGGRLIQKNSFSGLLIALNHG
jgi:hypothetical protein